jgi:hypothetical protein
MTHKHPIPYSDCNGAGKETVFELFNMCKQGLLRSISDSVHRTVGRMNRFQRMSLLHRLRSCHDTQGVSTDNSIEDLLKFCTDQPTIDDLGDIALIIGGAFRFRLTREPHGQVLMLRPLDPSEDDLLSELRWNLYSILVTLNGFCGEVNEQASLLSQNEKICQLDSIDSIVCACVYYGWEPAVEFRTRRP